MGLIKKPSGSAGEVLIATCDNAFGEALSAELKTQGFASRRVQEVPHLWSDCPDFLILDLDPAREVPWDLLGGLRSRPDTAGVPIITLSQFIVEVPQVHAMISLGVSDCVRKPCDAKLLAHLIMARWMGRPRRRRAEAASYRTSDRSLEIDLITHSCRLRGRELRLSPKEFSLLGFLMCRGRSVVTKAELLRSFWPTGTDEAGTPVGLQQYIARLRRKLGPLKDRIETVPSLGYRFRL